MTYKLLMRIVQGLTIVALWLMSGSNTSINPEIKLTEIAYFTLNNLLHLFSNSIIFFLIKFLENVLKMRKL